MDAVEEDFLVGCNLNSNITLDVVNETTSVDSIVMLPLSATCHIVFDNPKEQD